MNSKELQRAWAKQVGIDRSQAVVLLNDLFALIFEKVYAGEEVRIGRFGKFILEDRKRYSNILKQVISIKRVVFVSYDKAQRDDPDVINHALAFVEEQGKV